jgi:hypothetical protein
MIRELGAKGLNTDAKVNIWIALATTFTALAGYEILALEGYRNWHTISWYAHKDRPIEAAIVVGWFGTLVFLLWHFSRPIKR